MANKKRCAILAAFLLLLCSQKIFSQDMGNIAFINAVADKQEVTNKEAVKFFLLIIGEAPQTYDINLNTLKSQELIDMNADIPGDMPLKRGLLASMIARKLNLSDSLLYLLLDFERFALRACKADDIMQYNTGEYDVISGGELIEIMTAMSVKLESGRAE